MSKNHEGISRDKIQALTGIKFQESKRVFQVGEENPNANKIRQIGDVWEEVNPYTGAVTVWEQKKGYKVKRSKSAGIVKDEIDKINSFWNCPHETCKCTSPTRLDNKFRSLRGMCSDCHFKSETQMRIDGNFKEYEQERMKQNAISWLRDVEADIQRLKEEIAKGISFLNEDGTVEKWESDTSVILNKIDSDVEQIKKNIMEQFSITDQEVSLEIK